MAEPEPAATAAPPDEERVLAGHEGRTSPRADFLSSLVLMLIAAGFFIASLCMPKFESWGLYAHPGMPPAFFALVMFLLSGAVFLRSIRGGGYRLNLSAGKISAFFRADNTVRFLVTLLGVALFLGTMRWLTFLVSSTLFLFGMMLYFKAGGLVRCLVISVVVGFSTWYLFKHVFLVPLP